MRLVRTQDTVLTVGDHLSAYVVEGTPHHLDLAAHLPWAAGPPAGTLAATRALLERIAGTPLPAALADRDALLVATGRRAPTAAETAAPGDLATRLPFPWADAHPPPDRG